MEPLKHPRVFIVRVFRAEGGELSGVVERVRSGERHRLEGADAVGRLIARLLAEECGDPHERE